jgi:hypothetical protein
MVRKHHDMPLSGGDRKALKKELSSYLAVLNVRPAFSYTTGR